MFGEIGLDGANNGVVFTYRGPPRRNEQTGRTIWLMHHDPSVWRMDMGSKLLRDIQTEPRQDKAPEAGWLLAGCWLAWRC